MWGAVTVLWRSVTDPSDRSTIRSNLSEMFVELAVSAQQLIWFAQQAEIDGLPDLAAALRAKAVADSGHAQAILDALAELDPEAGSDAMAHRVRSLNRIDGLVTAEVLVDAVVPAASAVVERLDALAALARDDGLDLVADSLEAIATSQRRHLDAIDQASGAR